MNLLIFLIDGKTARLWPTEMRAHKLQTRLSYDKRKYALRTQKRILAMRISFKVLTLKRAGEDLINHLGQRLWYLSGFAFLHWSNNSLRAKEQELKFLLLPIFLDIE